MSNSVANYRPEGCKVLVEADKVEERTSGGLYIPQTSQESQQTRVTQGTVLAIGPGVDAYFKREDDAPKSPLKVGDRVIFAKYGGFNLDDKEHDYRIINDEDVVALIN